jgi:Uma2 family endonuclease
MNAMISPLLTTPQPARFTVDEFIRLCETGVFDDLAKTELIEGEIVCMNAQWSPHARVKSRLALELGLALRVLQSPFEPVVEVSIRLSDIPCPSRTSRSPAIAAKVLCR